MRIIKEIIEGEYYFDIQVTEEEKEAITDGFVISEPIEFLGKTLNIGVSTILEEDEYDN